MPDDHSLYDIAFGSSVEGYLELRRGDRNVPPRWIETYKKRRKVQEKDLAKLLKKKSLEAIPLLREWETAYRMECFYQGIRILMELERDGVSER